MSVREDIRRNPCPRAGVGPRDRRICRAGGRQHRLCALGSGPGRDRQQQQASRDQSHERHAPGTNSFRRDRRHPRARIQFAHRLIVQPLVKFQHHGLPSCLQAAPQGDKLNNWRSTPPTSIWPHSSNPARWAWRNHPPHRAAGAACISFSVPRSEAP